MRCFQTAYARLGGHELHHVALNPVSIKHQPQQLHWWKWCHPQRNPSHLYSTCMCLALHGAAGEEGREASVPPPAQPSNPHPAGPHSPRLRPHFPQSCGQPVEQQQQWRQQWQQWRQQWRLVCCGTACACASAVGRWVDCAGAKEWTAVGGPATALPSAGQYCGPCRQAEVILCWCVPGLPGAVLEGCVVERHGWR